MSIPMHTSSRGVIRMAVMPPPTKPAVTTRRQLPMFNFGTTTTSTGGIVHHRDGPSGIDDEEGLVVILGATGTGKSKLSIDIGTSYPSEVINSDKIQVYKGLDITSNKMPMAERRGVPHHLLGELDLAKDGELDAMGFRSVASKRIAAIRSRRRLPILAGGSNSFVHGLLAKQFDPTQNPFEEEDVLHSLAAPAFNRQKKQQQQPLNYHNCMLWVDVRWEVLSENLDRRVDEMVEMGMVEELAAHYDSKRAEEGKYRGLEMAIGVPEFDRFFQRFPPPAQGVWTLGGRRGEREACEEAVDEIKRNTRVLAKRQAEKIHTLQKKQGWEMKKVDATEAVVRKMEGKAAAVVKEAWERDVMRPAMEEMAGFLGGVAAPCGVLRHLRRSSRGSRDWSSVTAAGFGDNAVAGSSL